MFEKIGTPEYKWGSTPCKEFILILNELKKTQQAITAAEVGIGIGATSLEILKTLRSGDTVYLFDFQFVLDEFAADIAKNPHLQNGVKIITMGNSTKTFDSFNWNFGKMILDKLYNKQPTEIFDAIYLDGAHTFMHTVAACVMLKKMLKPSGYLVFDDVFWTLGGYVKAHPEKSENVIKGYTEEQLETPHIAMVVDIFMKTDPTFRKITLGENKHRIIYQRIA